MKLLITGSFGNEDIGDDAMLTMHLNNLYKQGIKKEDIHLLGFKPKYMSWYWDFPIKNCHSGFKCIPLGDIDKVIITGGGTINTRHKSSSLNRMYEFVKKVLYLPIFMSGQTIGPLGINKEDDKKAKYILEKVDILTVRDLKYSKEYIDKIKAKVKIFSETIDDATLLMTSNIDYFVEKNTVAFNITEYTSDTDEKIETNIKLCKNIIKLGFKILMIPHHPIDAKRLEIINDGVRDDNCKLLDIKGLRGSDIKAIISKCIYGIGGRYHFLVFCITSGIPCIGIAVNEYSYIKQMGFIRQYGLNNIIPIIPLYFPLSLIKRQKIVYNIKPLSFEILNNWL
jgi:polysaccharide pyruvyl transferase WcaK-like protein